MSASQDTAKKQEHLAYRPDIDGLRAVAVLAVLIFHAFPSVLPGGFIGVDIFFVISGFLISDIIGRNLAGGTFSFADFYARRIRRIFPALSIVLMVTLILGALLLTSDDLQLLGRHTTAGAAFYSNFRLLRESGYFDTSAELKPLLHLWSLAIEEQFYIIWPLLMVGCWKLKIKPGVLAAVTIVASFAFCLFMLDKDPTKAFYLPVTRVWELALGAGLAFTISAGPVLDATRSRQFSATGGLALITAGLILIDSTKAFPGWWALLPTVGTLLLIWAGPQAAVNRFVLANRVTVAVGLVSFPLYLWHWPLLVFLKYYQGELPDWRLRLLALIASAVLATLTYFIVEKPVRFGGRRRTKMMVLALIMIALAALGWGLTKSIPHLQSFYGSQQESRFKSVRDHTGICAIAGFDKSFCNTDSTDIPEVVLIGDSHAERLYWGMKKIYAAAGISFALFGGSGGCPPYIDLDTANVRQKEHGCMDKSGRALDYIIHEPRIRTVILNSRGPFYTETENLIHDAGDVWTLTLNGEADLQRPNMDTLLIAMARTLRDLQAAGKQIIYLHDVPELRFDAGTCLPSAAWQIQRKVRQDCFERSEDFATRAGVYRKAVDALLMKYSNVRIVDLAQALCNDQQCMVLKDGRALYSDDNHLSVFGATYVSETLKDQLLPK